jgi:hypothetical protein
MALDLIQRRREGRPLPRKRKLPAVTQEELVALDEIIQPARTQGATT